MRRTGTMDLRLHYGGAPRWLLVRMINLAKQIFRIIESEQGPDEILRRISDPLFFQACSNVLGFDWDSSGSTTVTSCVLKKVFNDLDLGIKVAGGKGEHSKKAPDEIVMLNELFNLNSHSTDQMLYASRMTAKVDNAAIQAGYQLYHHSFFISESGEWAVVQQGLNFETNTARRYHWLSSELRSFIEEPHSGILGQKVHEKVLDMTSIKSDHCRKICTDLANTLPEKTQRQYLEILSPNMPRDWGGLRPESRQEYGLPRKVNWKALKELYEIKPKNYEGLLSVKGIGPATVRGLALVSEIIYGVSPSWEDPLKFSYAFGGKDGVPFPVKRRSMDQAIEFLKNAVEASELGSKEKLDAFKRLRTFAPKTYDYTDKK